MHDPLLVHMFQSTRNLVDIFDYSLLLEVNLVLHSFFNHEL